MKKGRIILWSPGYVIPGAMEEGAAAWVQW